MTQAKGPSRRRFLAAGLAATLAGPFRVAAQAERARKIGILVAAGAKGPNNMDVFFQGMRELGYVLDRNLLVETRFAEHREERLPALAAELLKQEVELLVAAGPAATRDDDGAYEESRRGARRCVTSSAPSISYGAIVWSWPR